jgi:hypothetical protein
VQVDLTHKQVSADRVIWQVRSKAGDDERLRGQAEARFEAGKITSIRLGALPWLPVTDNMPVITCGGRGLCGL